MARQVAAGHLRSRGADVFDDHPTTPKRYQKRALLHRWLVDDPKGWRPGAAPAPSPTAPPTSTGCCATNTGWRRPGWGRFLHFTYLDLRLHSFTALRTNAAVRLALLVLGDYPGEWEGEHPCTPGQPSGSASFTWRQRPPVPRDPRPAVARLGTFRPAGPAVRDGSQSPATSTTCAPPCWRRSATPKRSHVGDTRGATSSCSTTAGPPSPSGMRRYTTASW